MASAETQGKAGDSPGPLVQGGRTERLLLAMAPVKDVLSAFCEESKGGGGSAEDRLGIRAQDAFAALVEPPWDDPFGPSDRYLKQLVNRFVRLVEGTDGTDLSSDALAGLLARASLVPAGSGAPDPLASCYLSFFLDRDGGGGGGPVFSLHPLRIRVFPDHNDVALRLWEAGSVLAEYLAEHREIASGRALLELGSGCGATGLVAAAACGPKSVHLTDYTEACRLNLEHNLLVNREWVERHCFSPGKITQGYLEWKSFLEDYAAHAAASSGGDGDQVDAANGPAANADANADASPSDGATMKAFLEADVLLAADVIYDINAIEDLVHVVKYFLSESPDSKQAIIASTKRNMATFEFFLETIAKYGMLYTWIARGEDCEALPRIFEGNFVQERRDVSICRIHTASFRES